MKSAPTRSQPADTCRLVLVDDHHVFRDVVRYLFEKQYPDLQVVGEASEAAAAYEVVERTDPHVVVLDVALSRENGLAVAKELVRRKPQRRVLMLSMLVDARRAAQAFEAGALGYATKNESPEAIAAAVRAVARGERYLSPDVSRQAPGAPGEGRHDAQLREQIDSLSGREREVFDLIIEGLPTSAVALRLGISPRTVETHRAHVLHKLGAQGAGDLVRIAARLKLLPG